MVFTIVMYAPIVSSVWKEVDKFANARQNHRTYIEGPKDPDKVLLPNRNLVPIALGDDEPEKCIPVTLLDHPYLDPGQKVLRLRHRKQMALQAK